MMSRLLIALDTATEAVGFGVARWDGAALEVLDSGCVVAPRKANTIALDTLVSSLERSGEPVAAAGAVVVGRGPGSFTGVRIGVATAKGLAQGLAVPLAGVGTLDALAWQLALGGYEGLLGVVGDAMRGEVYPALFACDGGRAQRLAPDRVAQPDAVSREWAATTEGPVLLAGNGLAKHGEIFSAGLGDRARLAPHEAAWPTGAGLFAALAAGEGGIEGALRAGDPATLLPIYTRLSDAEENERQRLGLDARLPDSGVAGGEVR